MVVNQKDRLHQRLPIDEDCPPIASMEGKMTVEEAKGKMAERIHRLHWSELDESCHKVSTHGNNT